MRDMNFELPIVNLDGVCKAMDKLKVAVKEYEERNVIARLGKALLQSGVKCNAITEGSDEEVFLDFSEHDKKVAEEKDKKIAELTEELWKMNEDFKKTASENTALQAENDQLYERISDLEFGDNSKIEELEKENNSLEEKLSLLRTRCKPGIEKDFDKGLFGKFAIVGCNEEFTDIQNKRISELEDRHQSDCIEINRLNVALEVMTEKYMKLREVHGLG